MLRSEKEALVQRLDSQKEAAREHPRSAETSPEAKSSARAVAAAEGARARVQEEYEAYKVNITRHLSELSERNGENQRFMAARLAAEQAENDGFRAQVADLQRAASAEDVAGIQRAQVHTVVSSFRVLRLTVLFFF